LGLTVLGHNLRIVANLRKNKKREVDGADTAKTAA